MLTNRFSLIIALVAIAGFAMFTISMLPLAHPVVQSGTNALLQQRRGEWTAGVTAEQAYLDQRYGEQTAGHAYDAPQAFQEYRHGEQTAGVSPVLAYLQYRRGEWTGK